MARSIHEILLDAQSKKYPNIIKKYDDITNVSAVTGDDGAELFQFLRANGEIDPVSGNPLGEYARVSKDNLADYSKRVFGNELPELISPHRFSDRTESPTSGRTYAQMDSPTSRIDPRYNEVKPNGINQNHGWKIHADFVTDLTKEQGLSRAGRAADLSIVDQNLADAFDSRLAGIGVKSDDFFNFYKTAAQKNLQGVYNFADPNDIISAAEAFNEQGLAYKIGPAKLGEGRHITAYPQSLEARDEITSKLENKLGNRLVDQNDPAFRLGLGNRDTGIKNHPISRGVSARFTTDYLAINSNTGKVDFSLSELDAALPEEYKISGEINPEEVNKINKVTQEMPEMAELLHGKDGYISPYKTIEQIAQERSTGKIAPTQPSELFSIRTFDEFNYKGPIPSINKPGVTSAPIAAPPSAPAATIQETIAKEDARINKAALDAAPATRESIEKSGYLYHYAPREARDSILSSGLQSSKSTTANAVNKMPGTYGHSIPDNSMYFFTNPEDAPSATWVTGANNSAQGPDLYRVKVEPGMLDNMKVDPELPLRNGIGSAVIAQSKTGSFSAELIGENARFESDGGKVDYFSRATYDSVTTADHGAEVSKATASGVSDPSVATTNATKVTPLADQYDTGTVAAKISAGEPLTVPPPVSTPPKGLKVGTPTDDIRVTPRNRGADSASGGKSKPKAQSSPINTSTQNPKPKPDPSAKITSNPPPSGEPTLKIGSTEPSKVTTKPKGLIDNGMKTAQDLASGNARAMGIAAAAGLLGVGIAMSNRKRTIAPDDGTYLSQSRAKLERLKGIAPSHRGSEAHVLYC